MYTLYLFITYTFSPHKDTHTHTNTHCTNKAWLCVRCGESCLPTAAWEKIPRQCQCSYLHDRQLVWKDRCKVLACVPGCTIPVKTGTFFHVGKRFPRPVWYIQYIHLVQISSFCPCHIHVITRTNNSINIGLIQYEFQYISIIIIISFL